MKAKPALILLAGLHLICASAASAQADSAGGAPVLPASSEKPTRVDPGPEEEPAETSLPKEGLVRLEVFTLSREEGRTATRKFPKQADLYAWLGAELEKEKPPVKLERLMLLRVRGGLKSKLEEIDEYPVPEKIDPPQIPQTAGMVQPPPAPSDATKPAQAPLPAASLISYTLRSTGWTAEIEMTISDDGETVDLNLAPEFVRLCGLETQSPSGEIRQPVFETSKIATQIVTKFGQPTLAGTFSPPVDAGVEGGNTEKVTRLLFLTVTDPR